MATFKTAKEALEAWDAGKDVSSVSMGGINASYEQAIQVTGFEVIRLILDGHPLPAENSLDQDRRVYWDRIDKALYALPLIDKQGLSGAQAGAAKHLAAMFVRHGHAMAVGLAETDRRLLVNKEFSRAKS